MTDIALLRLQYEILNASIEQLAQESGISQKMLRMEAAAANWTQWWPNKASALAVPMPFDPHTDQEDDNPFETQTNEYIENARRRLKAYSLAKELLLAARYLDLEVSIIDKAKDLIEQVTTPNEAKLLSALYKDLTSNSNLANLATMALGQDDSGMPTFILRDLSGSASR